VLVRIEVPYLLKTQTTRGDQVAVD
jgi:hypothetical protein